MVDSRKADVMVEPEDLDTRVDRVAGKLDALAVSVDERFNQVDERFNQVDERFRQVDERFDEVTAAIVEQRQYTEWAFGALDARLSGLERLEPRLSAVERQLGTEIVPAIARLEGGVGRIERKLDGFIEAQTRTNELVDKRLSRLERPRRGNRG